MRTNKLNASSNVLLAYQRKKRSIHFFHNCFDSGRKEKNWDGGKQKKTMYVEKMREKKCNCTFGGRERLLESQPAGWCLKGWWIVRRQKTAKPCCNSFACASGRTRKIKYIKKIKRGRNIKMSEGEKKSGRG